MNRFAFRIRLSTAIAQTHGVVAQWRTDTVVHEKIKGVGTWKGEVHTYELVQHAQARYCYAWANEVGDNAEVIMVLKVQTVDSPQAAVREYLLSCQQAAAEKKAQAKN